jgi:hypothetical protein
MSACEDDARNASDRPGEPSESAQQFSSHHPDDDSEPGDLSEGCLLLEGAALILYYVLVGATLFTLFQLWKWIST